MSKLQIAMSEDELERIYEVLNKASASFQLKDGERYNYRSTIVKIVEDYGRTHGLINEKHEVVNGVESNGDERAFLEDMISAVETRPNASGARQLGELVQKLNPKYRTPNEGATQALILEAKRLLEAT